MRKSAKISFLLWILVTILFVGCHGYKPEASNEKTQDFLKGKTGCPTLTGTYELYGEALQGMPNYYRLYNAKLTIDRMLGRDLQPREIAKVVAVQFLDNYGLEVVFHGVEREISRKPAFPAQAKFQCSENKVKIFKKIQQYGEATTGTAEVQTLLYLDKDRNLIIETNIEGHGRTLFFSWDDEPEHYGARFKRK